MMIRLPWAGTVVAVACLAIASARFADANPKQSAPAPRPAPHPVMSAPRPQMGGGAPHLPGNMGGGAHLPGNMAGHYPGGGGAGSGAHLPSNMGHAQPHTVGMAQHQTQSRTQPQRAETQRTRPEEGRRQTEGGRGEHPEEGRHDTAGGREERGNAQRPEKARDERGNQSGEAHGGPRQHTAEAKKTLSPGQTPHGYAAKYDSRLGGSARLNTRGLREAMGMPHAPRPFLHAPAHRDIAGDHAFAAAHAHDFHVRDVRGFTPRELSVWRGGRWHNEWHYGRRGWWWEVDGVWYGYPEPIWPYPVEVADLTVYDTPVIDGPDLTAYEEPVAAPDATATEDAAAEPPADQPPADQPQADQSAQQVAAVIPPLPPAPAGWFRCEQPGGYYPGVNACGTGWTLVQTAPLPGEQ
jgi:hypothetical protein